jgi:hypothetical protein
VRQQWHIANAFDVRLPDEAQRRKRRERRNIAITIASGKAITKASAESFTDNSNPLTSHW